MIHLVSRHGGIATVEFVNATLKDHLLLKCHELLDLQVERFHGVLAWRCFSDLEVVLAPQSSRNLDTAMIAKSRGHLDWPPTEATDSYSLRFWMMHAMRGKPELSEDLCRELTDFWDEESSLRDRWLGSCLPTATSFSYDISSEHMTALHAAAAFGYTKLAISLIENGHRDELTRQNADRFTPVSDEYKFTHPRPSGTDIRISCTLPLYSATRRLPRPYYMKARKTQLIMTASLAQHFT